jgi:hypothetical protein
MTEIHLLCVEDDDNDIAGCRDSVEVYEREHSVKIHLSIAKDLKEASDKLLQPFDGAIVDLRLRGNAGEGNTVLQRLRDNCFRMPVVILTATPGDLATTYPVVKTFTKGTAKYSEIFDVFFKIYKIGLTQIIGGRGKIENSLALIFEKNIMPTWEMWVPYAEAGKDTEKPLLRYVLSHMLESLDADDDICFKEEMYLHPPVSPALRLGSLINEIGKSDFYVVLTPPCDLASRKGKSPKTDRFLIAKIEDNSKIISEAIEKEETAEKKKDRIKEVIKNNYKGHLHWIPDVAFFGGGFINFRKIDGIDKETLEKRFNLPPQIQIAPHLIKNILARFSSYYARQGQPDLDFKEISKNLHKKMTEK